jgi:protein dithiol oxidoreductase (disulfide-forming)
MMFRTLLLAVALVPLAACAQDATEQPRQGVDYHAIPNGQPLDPKPGRIEVVEVFAYTCGFCAQLEPVITPWAADVADDVDVVHLPAAFGGAIDNFARGYFAASSLGIAEQAHRPMFDAFHKEGRMRQGSEQEIAEFYAGFSDEVDAERMLQMMKSFAMNSRINRARQFAANAGIDGTPQIVVNGKYRVVSTREGGFDGMLRTVDMLIERERSGD